MVTTDRHCETCRWWFFGKCLQILFAEYPSVTPAGGVTKATDTCGQWAEKEKRDDD